jgi:hypothetical protein
MVGISASGTPPFRYAKESAEFLLSSDSWCAYNKTAGVVGIATVESKFQRDMRSSLGERQPQFGALRSDSS